MTFISKTFTALSIVLGSISFAHADTNLSALNQNGFNFNPGQSDNSPFKEGTDYVTITPKVPPSNDSNVEVINFFTYGCKPCSASFDVLNDWKKTMPYYARVLLSPVSPDNKYSYPARIYFTLEKLDRLDINDELMKTSIDGKTNLKDFKVLHSWMQSRGIEPETFNKAFDSNEVVAKLYSAPSILKLYQVQAIPAVVVDGHYIIPEASMRDKKHFVDLLNYLVTKAAKEHPSLK